MTHSRSTQHSDPFMEIPPLEEDEEMFEERESPKTFPVQSTPQRKKDPKGSKEWQMLYSNAISETIQESPPIQTRRTPSPQSYVPKPSPPSKSYDSLDFDDNISLENLKAVDEQLKKIRQEEEILAQRAKEAEILHHQFEKFVKARSANLENLKRDLKTAEQEIVLAKARIDGLVEFQQILGQELNALQEMRPDSWTNDQKLSYLEGSKMTVQSAAEKHRDFKQFLNSKSGGRFSRLVMGTGQFEPAPWLSLFRSPDFNYWLQMGLAFMLPIIVFLSVFALVWKYIQSF